ncbi:MAG: hypothetical protein ACPK7O_10505 [Methanobacterium sp.]
MSLFYPTILGNTQCPNCEGSHVNPISKLDYKGTLFESSLLPNNLNVLFHCPDCGTVFIDYFNLNVEKKRKKLFSLIEDLDKKEKELKEHALISN